MAGTPRITMDYFVSSLYIMWLCCTAINTCSTRMSRSTRITTVHFVTATLCCTCTCILLLTCLLSSAFCSLSLMSFSDSVRRLILGGDTGRRGLSLVAGFKMTSKARLPDFWTGLSAAQQVHIMTVVYNSTCINKTCLDSRFRQGLITSINMYMYVGFTPWFSQILKFQRFH